MEIGSGLAQVSVLPILVEHYSQRVNLAENVVGCHMGGVYSSFFFLGSFVGPLIGGGMLRFIEYPIVCHVMGVLLLCELVLVWLCDRRSLGTLLRPWRDENVDPCQG